MDPGADEVEPVRDRYWTARGRAPVVLVVTTTMDCNLGCYYCYESRSGDAIGADSADDLARMDLNLLAAMADARPDWSIVIVGPYRNTTNSAKNAASA